MNKPDRIQVNFPTTERIKEIAAQLYAETRHEFRLRFRGGPPLKQHVLSALLLYVHSLDAESRRKIIESGFAMLDAHLADEPQAELGPTADVPLSGLVGDLPAMGDQGRSQRARRRA